MFVAKREGRDDLIFINGRNGRTFNFPDLYEKILESFFPDIPKYDDLVKDLHADRIMYQHRFESLTYTIRQLEAEKYVNFVENVMRNVGIIHDNEKIHPTNSLIEILLTEKEKSEKIDYNIFQKIFDRLANKEASNITVDIKSMIKKMGGLIEFARILRMNIIPNPFYFKLINDKWYLAINLKFHDVIQIRDLENKATFSYQNLQENSKVLNDFL